MKVKEFSNYRAPRRRPWVAIAIAVVVVLVIVWRIYRPSRKTQVDAPVVETTDQAQVAPPVERGSRERQPPPPVTGDVALPGDVSALMEQAGQHRQANRLQAARELYQRALSLARDEAVRQEVERNLGALHIAMIFAPHDMPEKVEYAIQSGNQLRTIARRFGTTVELIQRGNGITNPDRIRIGDRLRVLTGTFTLEASKSRRDMVVYLNGTFFKRYRIGTGEFGKTPVGTFVIQEKLVEPSWWPPDGREVPFGHPDNILGTRWMSIQATGDTPPVRGYGIHGTWAPESIGHAESAGCIRMINTEVEELYVYLPVRTALTIVE